ncbi:MAG TPA: DUF3027 domain-containing protein [Candidatus Didemnitutus sp.]|nr:DUF3027 domain-containing protein [Candidatus Didemnitutus sp.]
MSIEHARTMLQQHVGATVVRAWKGYGSALFLDLAEGQDPKDVFFGFEWRCERGSVVERGWNDSMPKIADLCETLNGLTVTAITIADGVPDLIVTLSDGRIIRTIVEDRPDWTVRMGPDLDVYLDDTWTLGGDGDTSMRTFHDEIHREDLELTSAADERWRSRITPNSTLNCWNCNFYRRINASNALLDWGVCLSPLSPYDGTAVNRGHLCDSHEIE